MARFITLGNQQLLVNIDKWMQVRDLYYPFVGQYNHLIDHAHRMAVLEGDDMTWLNDDSWSRDAKYIDDTLITASVATNQNRNLAIEFEEGVLPEANIFFRKITLKNNADHERELRFCYHHDFHMYGDGIGDTGFYDPKHKALIHYKLATYFLIAFCTPEGHPYVFDYDIGPHTEPALQLAKRGIHQGTISSVMGITFKVPAHGEYSFVYYLAAGKDFNEVYELNKFFLSQKQEDHSKHTQAQDKIWLNSIKPDISVLPENLQKLFKRSLLTIKTQVNKNGAIIAATDTDIMQFNRDTYCYMWPRDGALVAIALIKAGYAKLARPFFEFCRDVLYEEGCLLHKYNPDKSLGSSWHPWVHKGVYSLPIQEDETALVLHALWIYYENTKDIEFIKQLYPKLIKPMGDFLAKHRYHPFDLPMESYDLWEERRGILTFTTSTVLAGLIAAKKFGHLYIDEEFCNDCIMGFKAIKQAMIKLLYNEEKGYFRRAVTLENGELQNDDAMDASSYGVFEFGVFDADDERVASHMKRMKEWLWVKTDVGGIARYWQDYYFAKSSDHDNVPGNPWFICTLWYAKWLIKKAKTHDDLKEALEIMNWVEAHTLSSGVLAEQLHPYTGEPLSVSPLTWSHAEFVDTVTNYANKYREIETQKQKHTDSVIATAIHKHEQYALSEPNPAYELPEPNPAYQLPTPPIHGGYTEETPVQHGGITFFDFIRSKILPKDEV